MMKHSVPWILLTAAGALLALGVYAWLLIPPDASETGIAVQDATRIGIAETVRPSSADPDANLPVNHPDRERILPETGHGAPMECRVTGRVLDPEGGPVAHASVQLRLATEDGPDDLTKAIQAGADGSFSVSLGGLEEIPETTRSACKLFGLAAAPRHEPGRWTAFDLTGFEAGSLEAYLELTLRPGASLRGRVVTAEGKSCAGAEVYLRLKGAGGCPNCKTDGQGRYAFFIRHQGLHLPAAVHYGMGLSDPKELLLDPGLDAVAPDLVIHGTGTLEGIARYPDGSPAEDLKLLARREPEEKPDFTGRERHPHSDHFAGREGLPYGITTTGPGGRFRFHGLDAGLYRIVDWGGEGAAAASPRAYSTGEKNAEVLAKIYCVRLRVLDEEGNGVPGARFSYRIHHEGDMVKEGDAYRRRGWGTTSGGGTMKRRDGIAFMRSTRLQPGDEVEIEAWTPSTFRTESAFPIVEGRFETCVDLVLEEPEAPGTLRLMVRGPEGELIPGYEGRIYPGSSYLSATRTFRVDRPEKLRTLSVPPGRYQISVSPGGEGLKWYFSAREEFEIAAGEAREITLTLPKGGHIRMVVYTPPGRDGSKLVLEYLEVPPDPSSTSAREGYGYQGIISGRYGSYMKRHCREHSAESNPYTSFDTPWLTPGWYTLKAGFSG